jgi:hypothetical protein
MFVITVPDDFRQSSTAKYKKSGTLLLVTNFAKDCKDSALVPNTNFPSDIISDALPSFFYYGWREFQQHPQWVLRKVSCGCGRLGNYAEHPPHA